MFEQGPAFHELWVSRGAILRGLQATIMISTTAILLGLVISAVLSVIAVFGPRLLRLAVTGYVYVLRGTPLLVTILFMYFGLAAVWQALPAEWSATFALGLFAGAYMTEILRGAMQSIPRAQIDAAKAIGLPFWSRIRSVVAPLSFRRALPSMTNIAVDLVKASTLVSALGVGELFLTGQQIAMRTLLIPEIYFALWVFYLLINWTLTSFGRWLEGRYRHVVY